MREIKFRAWDKERKEWQYFTLHELSIGRVSQFWSKLENWCEYTELLDKNSKEIYEGDVVKGTHKIIGDWKAKVDILATGVWFGGARFNEIENYEIIGNIYENKELLK